MRAMADDFEKAILFTFDQTGGVDAGIKAQAEAYLEQARASPDCWQLCLSRFEASGYVEVRFWCAQTLCQLARHSFRQLPPAARAQMKAALIRHGTQAGQLLPSFLAHLPAGTAPAAAAGGHAAAASPPAPAAPEHCPWLAHLSRTASWPSQL